MPLVLHRSTVLCSREQCQPSHISSDSEKLPVDEPTWLKFEKEFVPGSHSESEITNWPLLVRELVQE